MRIFNGEEETNTHSAYFRIYDKLIQNRIIFLSEEICSENAAIIIGLLLMLNEESREEPITFYINSPGGAVEASFGIYDTMQLIEAPIKTICCGEASSFAAILLSAGSKGMRYATPNSRIMIHQIQIEGTGDGRGTDIQIEAKEVSILKKKLTEVIARHTGQTYRKVKRDCENDKYMSAKDALAYGIVDEVMNPHKPIPELKNRQRSTKTSAS